MLDCALISADEGFRQNVLGLVRETENRAHLVIDLQTPGDTLGREDLKKVLAARAKVVFLDLGESPSGIGGIQVLSQEAPDLALVVAGPSLSAEGLLSVMRAGASEYLPRPFSSEETSEAFSRVRRRVRLVSKDESSQAPGRVITVFSSKGGTGVTTVATNLAIALRMLTNKAILLLDTAPALGTAPVAMGLQPKYSYLDVVQNFHRIDEELFRSFLDTHDSGVDLLASPSTLSGVGLPSPDDIHGLVSLCKLHSDYVVIDGGNSLTEHLLNFLQESDERILVVTPDLSSLRNLKQALLLYGRMSGKAPPKVVLNQYRENLGLALADVEDGLGQSVSVVLEKDDVTILQSINLGRPEVQSGRSRFARNMMKLGSQLAGSDELAQPPKGLFRRFLRSSKPAVTGGKETE